MPWHRDRACNAGARVSSGGEDKGVREYKAAGGRGSGALAPGWLEPEAPSLPPAQIQDEGLPPPMLNQLNMVGATISQTHLSNQIN